MSAFSKDLDFFDRSLFDPLARIRKSLSNVTIHSKLEENVSGEGEESVETEEEDEEEMKPRNEVGGKEGGSDKEDDLEPMSANSWSEDVSLTKRSFDSWDLPVGPVAWDDNNKPMECLFNYADLTLTEEEENGLLTDRIVAACSSYLTESPGNKCHVVAKVSLKNKNLSDIRILGYHRFLQYVDLSWNNLTDLTPLGCIPYLMYLDVSHNLLEEVLRFRPLINLTYVNYSYNEVWQIDDLTDFWALCYLDLSHNKISKIQGLHNLRYLRHLDLSHNKIERFENLNGLRITDLNLEYNLISRFEMELDLGLKTMPNLTNLHLNNNLITSLDFLKGVYSLKKLELHSNNISDLLELSNMKLLQNLRHLDMSRNPVSQQKPYRQVLLNILQELRFLDQTEVDISERVAACKKKRFDVQLEAARNSARMTLLDQLNDTSLELDVLPVDQGPYPFVILVGPSASFKKFLVSSLGEKYPEKIYIGRLQTTREVLESEKNVLIHTSREEFYENIKGGKFLCVTENLGELYGFGRDELAMAVKEHKLCLTCMDMIGALTIHSYGIQPFLVLTIPESRDGHIQRLKMTYGPILSAIGKAYMAARQLENTHDSNVKRVKTIMDDLLNNVMNTLAISHLSLSSESPDSSDRRLARPGFESRIPGWSINSDEERDENQSESEAGNSREVVCYRTKKACFACTPSKCGYQTSRLGRKVGSQSSLLSKNSKRYSASDLEVKGETTTTSFSAIEPPPMRVEISSSEGSSYGEDDPFSDWSMPFIDWSEVNLNQLQLEEAAELLCEKYIESVMSTRDVYQSLHLENPGLFSLCVFSDDTKKAIKDISKCLKEVWRSTPNRHPAFDLTQDRVYQAFVPRKLEKLKEMLRNDFLSGDGDRTSKGLTEAPPLNSPASICSEMRFQGYGDSTENL